MVEHPVLSLAMYWQVEQQGEDGTWSARPAQHADPEHAEQELAMLLRLARKEKRPLPELRVVQKHGGRLYGASMATRLMDLGFTSELPPSSTHVLPMYAQHVFRGQRLFIEHVRGVTLERVKVGIEDQDSIQSASTLFYSVPVSSKTIDRMNRMLETMKGDAPDDTLLRYLWDEKCEPDAVMGLPVHMDAAHVGGEISFCFQNHNEHAVRVTGVLRGLAVI